MIYPDINGLEFKSLSDQYLKKNISVMFGNKITGTEVTTNPCVTFVVKSKLPTEQLSKEDIIPSMVMIDNKRFPTDVIEIKDAQFLACNPTCSAWETTPPGNRGTVRPLKGGVSIIGKNKIASGICGAGTLGFIAVDKASQALVGITAAHVVVNNPIVTSWQDLTKPIQNETDDYIYQNGETCSENPALKIGQVVRYVPMFPNIPPTYIPPEYYNAESNNFVDAAAISLSAADVSNTESFKQYGLNYNLPLPFATTAEVESLAGIDLTLYSSGRTTGAKGDSPCNLQLVGLYFTGTPLQIPGYTIQGQSTTIPFDNFYAFKYRDNPDCYPVQPGDSGSALIGVIDGVRKIVGLVFASGQVNNIKVGFACRIDWIAAQLGIEAWDGTPKNFINPASIAYTTVPGKSFEPAIKKDGKIYWQVGLTNI